MAKISQGNNGNKNLIQQLEFQLYLLSSFKTEYVMNVQPSPESQLMEFVCSGVSVSGLQQVQDIIKITVSPTTNCSVRHKETTIWWYDASRPQFTSFEPITRFLISDRSSIEIAQFAIK